MIPCSTTSASPARNSAAGSVASVATSISTAWGCLTRHQVLPLGQVDACFAAHRSVDHGQQCGGHLHEGHAAQIGGRGEARHIADDPAAQGDDGAAPVQPGGEEAVVEVADGVEALVLLAFGHQDEVRVEAGGGQAGGQRGRALS